MINTNNCYTWCLVDKSKDICCKDCDKTKSEYIYRCTDIGIAKCKIQNMESNNGESNS